MRGITARSAAPPRLPFRHPAAPPPPRTLSRHPREGGGHLPAVEAAAPFRAGPRIPRLRGDRRGSGRRWCATTAAAPPSPPQHRRHPCNTTVIPATPPSPPRRRGAISVSCRSRSRWRTGSTVGACPGPRSGAAAPFRDGPRLGGRGDEWGTAVTTPPSPPPPLSSPRT